MSRVLADILGARNPEFSFGLRKLESIAGLPRADIRLMLDVQQKARDKIMMLGFDPKATTGGTMIFRFAWSLSLVVAVAFIGIFLDPRHEIPWHKYPGDVLWWRPFVRMAAYSYVAYSVSALIWFLCKRKFRPEKLRTAPDRLLVKPRHDTAVIPTIKESKND